jgi:hypothetical protein
MAARKAGRSASSRLPNLSLVLLLVGLTVLSCGAIGSDQCVPLHTIATLHQHGAAAPKATPCFAVGSSNAGTKHLGSLGVGPESL